MAVIQTTERLTALLARFMCAEAEGDGELGMLKVSNVGVNRIRADCLDFQMYAPLKIYATARWL